MDETVHEIVCYLGDDVVLIGAGTEQDAETYCVTRRRQGIPAYWRDETHIITGD